MTVSENKKSTDKSKKTIRKMRLMKPEDMSQCLRIFMEHDIESSAHGLYTYRQLDPEGSWVTEHYKTGNGFYYI